VVNRVPAPNPPEVAELTARVPTEFEVAEVKPSAPGETVSRSRYSAGGRLTLENWTLQDLMQMCWDVDESRIAGAPKWFQVNRFTIVAKAPLSPGDDEPGLEAMRGMLRALLVERFGLRVHEDQQPVPAYLLTKGKREPKLKEADASVRSECNVTVGTQGTIPIRNWTCRNKTMANLAAEIGGIARQYIDHPVVDLTGLTGSYDFTVSYTGKAMVRSAQQRTEDGAATADPSGALTLFEAIDKQLGLRLELGKHPMPVIVIEHVDAAPAAN